MYAIAGLSDDLSRTTSERFLDPFIVLSVFHYACAAFFSVFCGRHFWGVFER
jgi:hypothetical protein